MTTTAEPGVCTQCGDPCTAPWQRCPPCFRGRRNAPTTPAEPGRVPARYRLDCVRCSHPLWFTRPDPVLPLCALCKGRAA